MTEHEFDWGKGLRVRIGVSILILCAALVSSLLYVAFWAVDFTLFQKIAVVLSILIIGAGAVGLLWVTWGGRFMKREWKSW